MIDAVQTALAAVPGWAWAGMGLFGMGVGRAVAGWQEGRALRRQVEAKCDTCGKPEGRCKCPDGTSSSLRLDVKQTLKLVGEVASEQREMRSELRGLRTDHNELREDVDRLKLGEYRAAAERVAAQLGRADPLAHLVEPPARKESR